jgi:glycosyltransferase involved in cell wall biosynthesis
MDKKKAIVSVVVPCFNEEKTLPGFYEQFTAVISDMPVGYELIFVDDGSKDGTLETIKNIANSDRNIRYISFSKNFGKEAAIAAGLEKSTGHYIVSIDADLQDPPELLPLMYKYVSEEGYDCAATCRISRKGEPPIRSFFANCFYRVIRTITEINLANGLRDYQMMTRQMLGAVLSIREKNRFTKGIYAWAGFRVKHLRFENRERFAGITKWSFFNLFVYSLDAITAFSSLPLHIASWLGAVFFLISVLGFAAGWDFMVCAILFISSIQLLCLGILGQYLAKTYTETKNRPLFLVKEESLIN